MRLLVLLLLLASPALSHPDLVTLRATDLDDGRVVVCEHVLIGEPIILTFTHSMYGGDVRETFIPTEDGRLQRIEMTTANEAAAEYYAYDAPVIREHGRFRVDVPPEMYEDVVIHVDHVGHHRLTVNGRQIDLLRRAGDEHDVQIQVRRIGLKARLTGSAC
ncbi:MAG TPA: DUF1850 domain-containing protein [Thermomicrobiales bacterium]|nr:DUF1850 domain-containing protein [Thermomicrobiales bacterium]